MIHKKIISSPLIGYSFIISVCAIFIGMSLNFAPHDFSNSYFGSVFLKEGTFNSSIYFPHIFNQEIAALGYPNIFVSYTPNTPFFSLVFVPLTYFPLHTAKIIFNIISLVLFIYSLRKLCLAYEIQPIYLFIIPLVFIIPLKNSFLFGQVYLLLFYLLTMGFLAYKKGDHLRMAFFWGFAILLKVIPIVLFGLFLFKKNIKACVYLGISCLLLLSISVAISGTAVWEFFFTTVLSKSGNGEITGEFIPLYQSAFMFLKGLFLTEDFTFSFLLFLYKLVLISIGYFFTKNTSSKIKLFSFWILLSMLLSPTGSSTYSNILLLFPFLFYASKKEFSMKSLLWIGLFFGIANIPIRYFYSLPLPFSFPRLFLSLILFFLIIRDSLKYIKWKPVLLFIIPVLLFYIVRLKTRETQVHSSELINDDHAIKYDYSIVDGVLNYSYWSEKGAQLQPTNISAATLKTTKLYVKENEIFYNDQQLTFDKSNKMKPAILNGNRLIYLSDLKRGIGFYQLRSIPFSIKCLKFER